MYHLSRNASAIAVALSFDGNVTEMADELLPTRELSRSSNYVIQDLLWDVLHRVCDEASMIAKHSNKHSIGMREIQTAVSFVFPGELGKRMIQHANQIYEEEYVYV